MNDKDRKYANILGINVISSSKREVLASVEHFITYKKKFFIVTPNPELVLASQEDGDLRRALNSADLPVPDGGGLKLAVPSLKIIKGRELFMDLIKLAKEKKWRVFLLGGMDNEAELAAEQLKMNSVSKNGRNSKLKIETHRGPRLNLKGEAATEVDRRLDKDAIERINKFAPQLLFVAFGNPKQEIWIHKNLSKLNIGGAMAVGGTFRYIAGLSPLPPKWMEKVGLEWLYRLINEPWRAVRIFQAVVVFPLKVFWYKAANSWRAR